MVKGRNGHGLCHERRCRQGDQESRSPRSDHLEHLDHLREKEREKRIDSMKTATTTPLWVHFERGFPSKMIKVINMLKVIKKIKVIMISRWAT